jgi:hypothetical protein
MRTALLAIALAWALGAACGGNDVEILECTGECTCNPETNTCACLGGTECVVEASGDVTLVCEGNARCDLSCGDGCHVSCPGTSGCQARMGDGSTGSCAGTADCDFTCAGTCRIDCPGSARCTLQCPPGAECEITSCFGQLEDCGDGLLVCRTACPA